MEPQIRHFTVKFSFFGELFIFRFGGCNKLFVCEFQRSNSLFGLVWLPFSVVNKHLVIFFGQPTGSKQALVNKNTVQAFLGQFKQETRNYNDFAPSGTEMDHTQASDVALGGTSQSEEAQVDFMEVELGSVCSICRMV